MNCLRYGVKVKPDVGENNVTVWSGGLEASGEKRFLPIAEEVTVAAADAKTHEKRPDVVIYVNGIALGVLELKRSTVSVAEGIRQNLDNQKKVFIERFFSTIQLVMAGNDTEGLALWRDPDAGKVLPDLEMRAAWAKRAARARRNRKPARTVRWFNFATSPAFWN